jgi:hypothetical protein
MVIYKITNLINGRQYIGRDSKNNPNYYGSGPAIKNAIKKYGRENFKKEIIEHCSSFENLIQREEYWLNYYDAGNSKMFYNNHNASIGWGIGNQNIMFGKSHSEETIKKISSANKGKKRSEETRKRLSEAGKKKILSESQMKQITELGKSNKGTKRTDESKRKMSQLKQGRQVSDETKKKMSENNKGCKNPFFGKSHSEETKKKISSANKGKKRSEEIKKKISETKRKKNSVIVL